MTTAVAPEKGKKSRKKALPKSKQNPTSELALTRKQTYQRNRFAKLAAEAMAEGKPEPDVVESLVSTHKVGFPQSDEQKARVLAVEIVSMVYHPQPATAES